MRSQIFVFGSNERGAHGRGAALHARKVYGAEYGVGRGRTGDAYALPTKDRFIQSLPLETIRRNVEEFLEYARANPELEFFVTRVGCGLAGYKDEQVAPMFRGHPKNCVMPESWKAYLME